MIWWAIILSALWFVILGLRLFRRFGILDKPGPDIIPMRLPVPNVQWIFLILGFFAIVAIFFPEFYLDVRFLWFAWGALVIFLVSLIDSFVPVKAKFRLFIQFFVAAFALRFGDSFLTEIVVQWQVVEIPFWIAFIVSCIWIVGFINAINWFDGINWLASGVSWIWFLALGLLIQFVVFPAFPNMTLANSQLLNMVSVMTFVLAILSFLYTIVEFKPLWVLRDVWTMFYWFALWYLSLVGGAKIGMILVALSLVIFDALWVVYVRIVVMKKHPMKWDYTHLHYRLMALWWTRSEVRFFVWIFSFAMMVLMLLQEDKRIGKIIIFIMMFVIFFGVHYYLFIIKKLPYEYKVWLKKD